MIKKLGILLVCCVCCNMVLLAQSSMSDRQVTNYVKTAIAAGKSQQTIAQELLQKGASQQQLQRLYNQYQESQGSGTATSGSSSQKSSNSRTTTGNSRRHTLSHSSTASRRTSTNRRTSKKSTLMDDEDDVYEDEDDYELYEDSLELMEPYEEEIPDSMQVFGRNLFENRSLDFTPSEFLATPRNYRLGPGDEVVIDIFGANQTTIRDEISPEGSIDVDVLGPLYLNGMTVDEANSYLKKRLAQIYAGLGKGSGTTDIRLSLGQVRTIQINVLGDVYNPGTYTVSPFATAFHALYLAGGIKEPGTLRNITVNRGGKVIAHVDIYDFLINGNRQGDIRLEEGDVIVVPAYDCMVTLRGLVKRPMLFEMKKGENLQNLLTYAGGFSKGAFRDYLTVIRQTGKDYEVHTVEDVNFASFALADGDSIHVGQLLSRYHNKLSIKGAVYREGLYQLSGQLNTVKALVEKAGGLLPEAFTSRAILHRERDDRSLEVLSIDLAGIMAGTAADVVLQNNDELYVPSIYDLKDRGILTINGEVASPGTFPYADNTTLEDLIIQAGGLLESSSLARVDVSRRVKDSNATTAKKEIAQLYSFSVKDNFVIEGQPGFILQPYDEVYVRKSPSYTEQQHVSATGEVNFAGTYPLTQREERLSSLVQKCGGMTDYAYIKGAKLIRKLNEEERAQADKVVESMVKVGTDSLTAARLANYGDTYYVGINLEKALANPGGPDDVILRAGDQLEVPVYSNTVRILGEVTSSNVVTYVDKKNYQYYIDEAGGYTDMARKGHAYIVHMNGHINRLKGHAKVTPGSQIVVPRRSHAKPTFAEVISSMSSVAALVSSLITTAYIIKK